MPSHDTLAAEAAAFLELLAGRLQRYAEPVGEHPAHDGQRCAACPICVALTYLDEHREVGVQLAQGMLTVVTALRQHIPPAGSAGDAAGRNAGRNPSSDPARVPGSGADEDPVTPSSAGTAGAEGAVQRIEIR